jgi:GntR family transcriptional regulator/MocR family aminotransferase
MLFSTLRIGFVVVPGKFVDALAAIRGYIDRHPATLHQAILAEFITEDHFGQHVRKYRPS